MLNTQFIPQIASADYQVDVCWNMLKSHIEHYEEAYKFEMNPDFQRGHVWTEEQQIAFVEWALKGGLNYSGKDIYLNCATFKNWKKKSPMVLVDGLQRMTAALKFLDGNLIVFGKYRCEEVGKLDMCTMRFRFHVADIQTRKGVLQWYLDFNSGGTVHTKDELNRVLEMMGKEK